MPLKIRRLIATLLLTASLQAETVRASFYADKFEGRRMSNGRPYHARCISAASLRYPLGSVLRLHSVQTGKTILVPITDRGPYSKKFSLDLSKAAFRSLGLQLHKGWGWVNVTKEKGSYIEQQERVHQSVQSRRSSLRTRALSVGH